MKNPYNRAIIKDDQIDFFALAHIIWNERKTVVVALGFAIITGLAIALFSPVMYSTSATILPQMENTPEIGGNIGGLASMAGINLGSIMDGDEGIQPALYPRIINSYPLVNELINHEYEYSDESVPVSIYDKELNDSTLNVGAFLKKYTVRLPWTIKKALVKDKFQIADPLDSTKKELIFLTKDERDLYYDISDRLSVSVDDETRLVTINAAMEEPVLTAQVTSRIVDLLQEYIIEYKTGQARNNLEFIEARLSEKKAELEAARSALFTYRDRNRNVVEERTNIHFEELRENYSLASEMYGSLAQEKEQAELSVKKNTPAFSVIEPVQVPLEKSSPRRTLIMIVSIFLGVFLGVLIIIGRLIVSKVKSRW